MATNRQMYNPQREEVFHIAGDPDQGIAGQYNLNRNREAEVQIRYKDRLLYVDVYRYGEELMVHLLCPRCLNCLSISSKNKQIDWDPQRGSLSIEPFQCTWENGLTDATQGRRMEFGLSLCRWTVGIDGNVARDA